MPPDEPPGHMRCEPHLTAPLLFDPARHTCPLGASHSIHDALPFSAAYFPTGQMVQTVSDDAPVTGEYFPASQVTHADAPAGEYVPAPQSTQALAPVMEYLPAPQVTHADAPAGEYAPAPQSTQVLAPVMEYLPERQLVQVQSVPPPRLLLPTIQTLFSLNAPEGQKRSGQ